MKLALVLVVALTAAPQEDPAVRRGAMQGALAALVELQPFLAARGRFDDPKNAELIDGHVTTLASLEHALPKKVEGEEPGLAALAGSLGSYLRNTQAHLRGGRREYARDRLLGVTQLCASCHTRTTAGAPSLDLSRKVEGLSLAPRERARLLVAVRQWDAAVLAYREALALPLADDFRAYAYLETAREALSVLVRVRSDVDGASALVSHELARKDLPEFVRRALSVWTKDLRAWKAERFDAHRASASDLFARAKKLLDKRGATSALSADEELDVVTLRASGYLHTALARAPEMKERGQALLYLGVAANTMRDSTLWDLQEVYLESCIRESPKTDLAKQCYLRFLDRVYFDYTGSAGTDVPKDVVQRVGELRQLAYGS